MKQIFKIVITAWVFVMVASPVVYADHTQPPAEKSSAELNRIKSLAGRWTSTTSMFGKKTNAFIPSLKSLQPVVLLTMEYTRVR